MRFGIPAALLAVIALALPALASANFPSADLLGEIHLYKEGLRPTAAVFGDTAGPDGNVWFVDNKIASGIPAIGRIKPSGEITEFVSGTNLSGLLPESDPVAIATGPEGKLWFTDKGTTPAIGVIDPAACTTECTAEEFSILEKGGNAGSVPQGIVAGPDGNLWFTDAGTTPAIGRINPSTHTIEEFSAGLNAGSAPHGIVASGGNLWFFDGGTTRAIGKINPSTHTIEEFATGANSEPGGSNNSVGQWGIAAGPDGNVWFNESGTNATEGRNAQGKAIGRITPAGSITYFGTGFAATSKPTGLTAAPDGKLWFTDFSGFNEKQEVTVEASSGLGGTYKLGFGGKETGWTGEGTLPAGVTGTGNLSTALGGKGTWSSGSTTITIAAAPTTGKFAVGQLIVDSPNPRIPAGTTITACSTTCNEVGSTLTISKATTGARENRALGAGDVEVTSGGPFEVGQAIDGPGIPENVTIGAINGSILFLSGTFPAFPTEEKAGVSLAAGSKSVTGVTTTTGTLVAGETISGTGIQSGTKVVSFNEEAGTLTLSKVATGSAGKAGLAADLGFAASGSVVAGALEKLSSIGAGNVSGFGEGSASPVKSEITFQGKFTKTDVEQMTCNGAGLTGTSPTCTVTTKFPGGPHAIGSIDPSSPEAGVTRYPNSAFNNGLVGLTAGPDGNLWFNTGETASMQFVKFGISPPNRRGLTVTKSAGGSGGIGSVMSKPKGVKCAANCSSAEASIYKNTQVTLKGKAATGSTLSGWSGCESETTISATEGTCTVTMSADQEVEAQFGGTSKPIASPQALSQAKAGSGFGTVKSKPGGIGCEADCTATAALFQTGKVVVLTAVSAPGSEFAGWSGCDAEPEGNCEVTMSGPKAVTATFNALPKNTLTVLKSPSPDLGTGTGAVTSKPKAVNCAANCSETSASLPEDALVVLKGKASSGSTLSGWTGCESTTTISATEGTCTVSMASAQEVTAQFGGTSKAIASPQALNLAKAGSGFGTVKSKPGGIACEAACESASALYLTGKVVVLTGTPAAGSQPVAWSGCDEVTGENTCVVTMSGTKNVTATFDELE